MKSYYRVMLGKGSKYAAECFEKGFIGTDFQIRQDLSAKLPEDWKSFNREFIPVYLEIHPDKTKVAAGLACGAIWTVSKGLEKGAVVVSPDGSGTYRIGEITGGYYYRPDGVLPHRRPVKWLPQTIDRTAMSLDLQHSAGAIGTISDLTRHGTEIETLLNQKGPPRLIPTDETIEDSSAFAIEEHLEEFLVANWAQTELGKKYDIFEEEGEQVGEQYPTDTGPIDILAVSKDRKELLVVELKKGRTSDIVVGQIQRYMGFVKEELAEPDQTVRGVIIALENDIKLRRALAVTQGIAFYRYQVYFKLMRE